MLAMTGRARVVPYILSLLTVQAAQPVRSWYRRRPSARAYARAVAAVAAVAEAGRRPSTGRPGRASSERATHLELGVLVLTIAVSAFAHLHRLGTTTPLLDELTYQQSGYDAVRGTVTAPAQPYLARHLFGLTQLVLGEGVVAARTVSAVASILTGVLLFALGRRIAGWWAGLGAFALWSVLPQATRAPDGSVTMLKLGRSALLEPLMVLFVVLALLLCWRWSERGRTRDAVLTGLALGAAVAAKPTAGLLAPVVVLGGFAALGISRRTLVHAGALATGALGVLLASYLPLGRGAPDAFQFMVEFQTREHAATGHAVILAGDVFARAPWWAYGWWQWRSVGTLAVVALVAAAAAGVVLSPRRWIVGVLAASILWPLAYLSLVARFGLAHYLHLWQPMLVLLAAVGAAELARRGSGARLCAAALAVALSVAGVQTLGAVATTEPRGYAAVGDLLADRDLAGRAVVVWGQTLVAEHELPGAQIVRAPEEATEPIVAVIVDPGTVARDPRPEVEAFLVTAGDDFERLAVDHLTLHLRR